VQLLDTFLKALELSNNVPRRLLLQTGGKHYGVHLGPTLMPMEESDPRFVKEPNFYFTQEDLLWKWCKEHKVGWSVTRPGYILGAVPDAAMNISYGLAIFAAVQKELGRKLAFPGDVRAWEALKDLSSAELIGLHAEWAMLTDGAEDHILNIADDSPFTYGKFWPVLASWYDLEYAVPESDTSKYRTLKMPIEPPPRGFGEAGMIKSTWSLEEWASEPEVREAWQTLKKRYNLVAPRDPFENPKDYFGLVDTDVLGPWGRSLRYVDPECIRILSMC
jgi:nucleoside-diphosphate-sugar epimerase